jgi:hypothetical protein
LAQLAVQAHVGAAGALAEHERLHVPDRVEQVEQALVRRLDHRTVLVGAAHQRTAADLAVGDERLRLLPAPVGLLRVVVEGQQPPGLVDGLRVVPAVVEHRLGEPLVGVVLDEAVAELDHRVGGGEAAAGDHRLEPVDERARIDHRLGVSAVGIGKGDHRDQPHRHRRQVVERRVAQHPGERDAPIAQHGAHLHRIRRAVGAAQLQGMSDHFWHSNRQKFRIATAGRACLRWDVKDSCRCPAAHLPSGGHPIRHHLRSRP